jgi:hypothetical protein
MAINTTLYQSSPYYDDYVSSGNEAKGHLKILFKPGIPVQTRELNQLQTLLQTQVDRFGSNVFEEGSRVLNGDVTIDGNLFWAEVVLTHADLKISSTSSPQVLAADTLTRMGLLTNIDSVTINSPESISLTADVVDYEAITTNDTTTKYRLYLRYTKGTASKQIFGNDVTIRAKNAISGTTIVSGTTIGTVSTTGFATKLHVDKGVYFVAGHFVNVEATNVIVERPDITTRITGRLAFKVTEAIKTTADDSSLFDNASGVPNASQPGADRYTISLGLVALTDQTALQSGSISYNTNKVFPLTGASSTEFVTLVSLKDGKQIKPLSTKYATGEGKLGNALTKRTFEQSGNYTISGFTAHLREAYNDGNGNNGKYSATESVDITRLKGDYVVEIDPGVAYISGERVEISNRFSLISDKARDAKTGETITVSTGLGTYIEGKFSEAYLPDIDGDNASPLTGTYEVGTSGLSISVTNIEKVRGTGLDTVFRFYYDLGTASHANINSATYIKDTVVSPNVQFNSIEPTFKVHGNKFAKKLIKLPRKAIKAVTTASTSYEFRREFAGAGSYGIDVSSIASGIIVLDTLGVGETFQSTNPNDYLVTIPGVDSPVSRAFGTVTNVSLNGAKTEATLTMSNITVIPGGANIAAIATLTKALSLATKTLNTGYTVSARPSPGGISTGEIIDLGVIDVVEVTTITSNNSPLQDSIIDLNDFVLDNGQRDNSYQNATLTYVGETTIEGDVDITLNYFSHGAGDYFSLESYPAAFQDGEDSYHKFPIYDGTRLSDVFDFRGSGAVSLTPNTKIKTVIDYYLPRIDQIVLTRRGEYLLKNGVSSQNPVPPKTETGSMALYNLYVNPYTYDATKIRKVSVHNERYTMGDIGDLEKRIENLEYYTSLSLLEKRTSDKQIFDSAGERFKNGFFVDNFNGHSRAEVDDPKHVCSIDRSLGQLFPSIDRNLVEVRLADNSPQEEDNLVRLPSLGTKEIVKQRFASVYESVIPYSATNYKGLVEISPSSDDWIEHRNRPLLNTDNVDGSYDNFEFSSSGTKTLGSENVQNRDDIGGVSLSDLEKAAKWMRDYLGTLHTDVSQDTTSTRTYGNRGRYVGGTQTGLSPDDPRNLGPHLPMPEATVEIIPFMRSRRIYFKATGLKPNTRHFAYFDDNNITAYATTLNGDDSPNANSFEDFRYRRLNSENRIDFFDQNASEVFTTLSDTRRNLTTDNAGTLEGYFIIPNNNTLKFSTGSIDFTLTDTNGGIEDLNRLSEAKAIYRATGTQYDYYDSEDGEVHVPSPQLLDSEVGPTAPRRLSNPGSGGGDPIVEPDALPVYVLSRSHEFREDGESFTITLTNTGGSVDDGTTIPFLIQGVTTSEFSGTQLTGTFTLTNNTGSVTYTCTTTEVHTFQLKLYDNTQPSLYDDVNPILVGFTEGETYVDEEYNCEGNYNYYEMVYLDPLAQSFNVGQFGIDDSPQVPEGIDSVFIKSLDLYFKGKDSAKPVTVQIVEVLNGYPYSSKIIKNGVVSLESSQVNISDDASSVTTFTFPSAVHLETNREYAFIVRSTSPDYTVWMAELGGEDISSGERIDKDPYLGVAFRSSNASTWTPVQTRDIKFTLNAHTFLAAGETTRTKTVGPAGTLTGAFETIPKNTPFTVSSIQFSPAQILPPKTEINYTLSIGGNSYSLTPDGAHLYLPSAVTVSSASDITLGATLTSSNQYATPVVDLDKISLLCNGYVINNDVTNETNAASGNATARYISKKVFLNDPADKLNVYLGVSQPEGSRVRLYARFDDEIASPQVLDLRDATWTELSSSRISEVSSLGDNTPFQEVEYEIDPTNDFTQFQLKIVMTSSDAAQVPAVTDLRAIATI